MENSLIKDLEATCLNFYTSSQESVNPKQDRKLADSLLSSFFSNKDNFSLFFYLSCNSQLLELQFLSTKAVLNHLPKQWNTFSLSDQLLLFKQLFDQLFTTTIPKPGYIQAALSKNFAIICRLSWFEIVFECNLISQIKSSVCKNRQNLYAALAFFQEILDEISQPGLYRSLSIQKKVFNSFQELMFGDIFMFCAELLSNFLSFSESELEKLLDTIGLCLNFEYNEAVDCVEGGWKELLDSIFQFTEKFLFAGEINENMKGKVLILFGNLSNAKKIWMAEGVERFIDQYLRISAEILALNSVPDAVICDFVKQLRSFCENFTLKQVSKSVFFLQWLNNLHNFTITQFLSPDSIISQYKSVLFLWNYLSNESHLIDLDCISLTVVSLFEPFIKLTLENCTSELILDNVPSIVEHLDVLSGFSLYFLTEFLQILTEFYRVLTEKWVQDRGIFNQAKLAWLLLVSSAFLLCKSTRSSVSDNSFILQQVFFVVENAVAGEVVLSVACAIYLTNYSRIWINAADESPDESAEDNESFVGSVKLLEKIVVFIFGHLQVNSHPIVVNYVLDLFEYLAKGHYSAKVLIQVNTIQDFSQNFLNYPLCLHNSKLRSKVFHVLACIWLHEQSTEELNCLLLPYEQAFISGSKGHPEFYEFLFREIQGICSAIVSKNEFFSWFVEKIDFFLGVCSEYFLEEPAINAFLKMIIEVTDSRGSRIHFPESSANGILMFKKISPLLSNYTNFISSKSSEIPNFLGKCKRILGIMKNFLTGCYICFGVFQVFEDPCFVNSIQSTFNIISRLVFSEITVKTIQTYSKLLDYIYEYFEALIRTHSRLLLSILSPEYLELLLVYLQNGLKSQSNH